MNVKALSQPWYKEPWPWMLMMGPGLVIIAGIITVWLAVRSFDGVVEDDYYKQGLTVNQRIHRDKLAQQLGLSAEVMRNGENIRLFLSSTTGMPLPQQVTLRLVHPTRGGVDQSVILESSSGGYFSGRLTADISGRWHVFIEDQDLTWRLQGDWQTNADAPLRLLPHH